MVVVLRYVFGTWLMGSPYGHGCGSVYGFVHPPPSKWYLHF